MPIPTTTPSDAESGATPDTPDTAALLRAAGQGDQSAWEEIVLRYGGLVSATVHSFELQDADTLDAIQTTWLRLMTNWHRVQDPERLSGWLVTTARRECLAILRQSTRAIYRADATSGTVADPSVGPEQCLLATETVLTVRGMVAELPLRGRAVLHALFSDSPRPYVEIADTTGIPLGSMGPTRGRALRQLRQMFDERELVMGISL